MSILVDRSGNSGRPATPRTGPPPRRPERSPVAAGALAAVQAATASLVVLLVPVVLAWATASYSQAPWGQAVQVGVGLWLLAHHAGIAIPGGHLGLVPLGAMAVPVVTCWFAGVRLARGLDPNADAIRAGVGRARPVLPPSRAMLTLVLGYAGLVTLIGVLATTTSVRPLVAQAFVGALLICGLSSLAGASAWVGGGLLPGIRRTVDWLRLPLQVRRCFRPAGMALGVHLLGALLLFVTALVFGWGQVMSLHRALAPGAAGTLVLVVGQLAVVPNLVIWTGAYAAGPGFAVGTDTSVAPGHVHLGALPAIPVLGALPNPGEVPSWAWAVLALPVLGGVLAGWLIMRRDVESVGSALQDAGMTALMAGTGWAVLGWLSGGPAGPGRLATFGPTVWQLGSAVVVEVALGAFVAVGIGLMVRHLAAPDGVQDDDGPGDLTPGTLAGPTLPPS